MTNKLSLLIAIFISLQSASMSYAEEPLLLTGKIASANKQIVTAPKNSRWNIQIQWLEEEGKVVEQGDLIATFDGSNLQAEIDTLIERKETLELELKQTTISLQQALLEAQGSVAVAKMRVEQAKIEANVPDGQVSSFDKGQYQLTLQRQLFELFKANEALDLAEQALESGVNKKQLELTKVEEQIKFKYEQLDNMSVTALYTGPVNYALHPWSGDKLSAGINIQSSWQVLDVQAIGNFQIESWVHEIDAPRVQQGTQVNVVFDAYPQQTFKAELMYKSTQAEKMNQLSNSVYFPLTFTLSTQPRFELLPGMSVRIEV